MILLLACAAPLSLDARAVPGGVEVVASAPMERVRVEDAAGVTLQTVRLPAPTATVLIPMEQGATLVVRIDGVEHRLAAPPLVQRPLTLTVAVPPGQPPVVVADGDVIPVPMIAGSAVQASVVATANVAAPLSLQVGDDARRIEQPVPGERLMLLPTVGAPLTIEARSGETTVRATLSPMLRSREQAAAELRLVDVTFPAEADGSPDLARPAGRVTLASPLWLSVLRHTPLGFRPRDPESPWAWQGVTLENTGDAPLDVVVRSRVATADGQPDPHFRPRVRERDDGTGTVSALLRVPPGQTATAALPLFVDEAVPEGGGWSLQTEVTPFGASEPLVREEQPLYVSRGSTLVSVGWLLTLCASVAGFFLMFRRAPVWLRTTRTSELVTIALFGSLQFVVGAAAQLIGTGVAAVLGPFATLLTGLIDDAFSYALLATLVTLLPRPGTATLSVLVGWLLRGLAFGSFSVTDLLFLGTRIACLEGALWAVGLTRGGAWRDQPRWSRWLRLSSGFAVASLVSTVTALLLHVVLYRLFFAGWYVAMMLALPGFLYVVIACWLAVGFADALREVEG